MAISYNTIRKNNTLESFTKAKAVVKEQEAEDAEYSNN